MGLLKTLKLELPYDPSIPLLDTYPEKKKLFKKMLAKKPEWLPQGSPHHAASEVWVTSFCGKG